MGRVLASDSFPSFSRRGWDICITSFIERFAVRISMSVPASVGEART
jgi:hypothetical protein